MSDKPRYSRISDILDLAIFMSSKIQGVTIMEIAERYNVSRRTAEPPDRDRSPERDSSIRRHVHNKCHSRLQFVYHGQAFTARAGIGTDRNLRQPAMIPNPHDDDLPAKNSARPAIWQTGRSFVISLPDQAEMFFQSGQPQRMVAGAQRLQNTPVGRAQRSAHRFVQTGQGLVAIGPAQIRHRLLDQTEQPVAAAGEQRINELNQRRLDELIAVHCKKIQAVAAHLFDRAGLPRQNIGKVVRYQPIGHFFTSLKYKKSTTKSKPNRKPPSPSPRGEWSQAIFAQCAQASAATTQAQREEKFPRKQP